jgi:hypothetical protein
VRDSVGTIIWDRPLLCSTFDVVAAVEVSNRGCADAPPSTTELTISGPGGWLASVSWPTTQLPAGKKASFLHVQPLPSPPPSAATIQACADTGGVVTGQCDTSGLCASRALPVSTSSGAPLLSFTVDVSAVHPGEDVFVAWQLTDDCTDLGGAVTAAVFFGSAQLFPGGAPTPLPVAPLGTVMEKHRQLTVPAQLAGTLFTVGQHTLELRVTSSTTPAKTFTTTGQLTVDLPADPTVFSWAQPSPIGFDPTGAATGTARRGAVYDVVAAVTNFSTLTAVTVSATTITETTTAAGFTGAGASAVSPPSSPIPKFVPGPTPPIPAAFGISNLLKTWTWIDPITFERSGPTTVPFSYVATFTIADSFGNGYPPVTSPMLTVPVTVSATKVALQVVAALELKGAAAAVAAGLNLILAFALWGMAIRDKAAADDPPVPDFEYEQRVRVEPTTYDLGRGDASPWAGNLSAG